MLEVDQLWSNLCSFFLMDGQYKTLKFELFRRRERERDL